MENIFYPKSPTGLPNGLTKLSPSYNFRAFLAVLSILLFFILYFSLVTALGYMVYMAIIYEVENINKFTILLKLGAIAGAVMLFLFTLKFIFKLRNPQIENRIKLDNDANPELVEFINNICIETGAPRPKSIYVDPDVNAYVSYSNMWLSLILPVKKDLTIGMGLISCLNLNEFKAVTSHEFGHFAQSSMKIGSYIISANTIIHDMIFTRDKWDEILEKWRGTDIRLSAAAWVITPIIWLIRQVLKLFYSFLNVMYSSLSREMEFNADKVAVSTSGSEAIISGLWKLDDGVNKWNATINYAYLAAQKKLYTKNLYEHYLLSLERGKDEQKELYRALPTDENGVKKYFSSSETSKVSMYASHPPNDQRERSAKTPFVACKSDDRSPWILFRQANVIQEQMTHLIYNQYLNQQPVSYVTASEFEAFVSQESKGDKLMKEYQHTFVNRFLYIPDDEELAAAIHDMKNKEITIAYIKSLLSELMKPVAEIEFLMNKAQEIASGTTKENEFVYNNVVYEKKHLETGFAELVKNREKLLNEHFKEWDILFCSYNLLLAMKHGKGETLKKLYYQHAAINKLYKAVVFQKNNIYNELATLQGRDDVSHAEINMFCDRIIQSVKELNFELDELNQLTFYPLPNIDTIDELKEAVIPNGKFPEISGPLFENGGFAVISNALESAIMHCQRLEQKNIAEILLFQADLQNETNT